MESIDGAFRMRDAFNKITHWKPYPELPKDE